MENDFTKERASLAAGVKHVAVYAPKGASIPMIQDGVERQTNSIRTKILLAEDSGSGNGSDDT